MGGRDGMAAFYIKHLITENCKSNRGLGRLVMFYKKLIINKIRKTAK